MPFVPEHFKEYFHEFSVFYHTNTRTKLSFFPLPLIRKTTCHIQIKQNIHKITTICPQEHFKPHSLKFPTFSLKKSTEKS